MPHFYVFAFFLGERRQTRDESEKQDKGERTDVEEKRNDAFLCFFPLMCFLLSTLASCWPLLALKKERNDSCSAGLLAELGDWA